MKNDNLLSSPVIISTAFCVLMSLVVIHSYLSLRVDLSTDLLRLEQQIISVQTTLASQEQILYLHSSDMRMQIAQMALWMRSSERSTQDDLHSDTLSEVSTDGEMVDAESRT